MTCGCFSQQTCTEGAASSWMTEQQETIGLPSLTWHRTKEKSVDKVKWSTNTEFRQADVKVISLQVFVQKRTNIEMMVDESTRWKKFSLSTSQSNPPQDQFTKCEIRTYSLQIFNKSNCYMCEWWDLMLTWKFQDCCWSLSNSFRSLVNVRQKRSFSLPVNRQTFWSARQHPTGNNWLAASFGWDILPLSSFFL